MIRFTMLMLILAAPALGQKTAVKLDPAAVRIIRKTYGENFSGLSPLNAKKGTSIALMLQSPKGGLIGISDKSALTSFTDDKGTNLLGKGFNQGIGGFPKVSEDGKAGMVEINGSGLPTRGAKEVRAKGTLKISLASTKKKLKSKPFAVKKGSKVTVGGIKFVLKKAGKPSFGDKPLPIQLEAKQDLSVIAAYHFEDSKGNKLKTSDAGSSRMDFGNSVTVTKGFNFEKKVENCVLVIEAWTDKKDVEVPFDVRIGIGG